MVTLRKPRRRRQRQSGETKNLMSKTLAKHVRFKNFVHLNSSYTEQKLEITNAYVLLERKPR